MQRMQNISSVSQNKLHPPTFLVGIGVAILFFQIWAYAGWIFAVIPLKRSPVEIPAEIAKAVEGAEFVLCFGAIVWLGALLIITARFRRLTLPLLLTLVWSSAYWQESLVNTRFHSFSYNSHFLNREDWTPYLPLMGFEKPLLYQPVLMEALVFFWMIPAVCLGAYGLLKLLNLRLKSPALLILFGSMSVMAFETGFEFSGIHQQLLAWNRVPQTLSLWPGTSHQWPLPELLLGLIWSLPALVWFFREHPKLKWIALGQLSGNLASTTMRVVALSALLNLAYLAYNALMIAIDFNTSAIFPPWLTG